MPDLSVLIPARQEEWLGQTVADVLSHTSARTEVIAVLDGAWPATPLPQDPRVQVLYLPTPIGQRAAVNLAARVSEAPWLVKLDAHCSVAPGFDTALLEAAATLGPTVVQVPAQRNLHVYDLVCDPCGFRADQAPHQPVCPQCQGPLRKELVWQARGGTRTTAWRFDAELHFQYGGPKSDGPYPETMSLLGACWCQSRQSFEAMGGLEEAHGSWGQCGVEVACKTWLSGGRLICNTLTEFAHFFRVGGIGFPYQIHGSEQDKARAYSRDLWRGNRWPGQVRPLRWLVEQFAPLNGWPQEAIETLPTTLPTAPAVVSVADRVEPAPIPVRTACRKSVVYYSDGRADFTILEAARRSLERSGFPIVAVTLKPIDWPAALNIVVPLQRGYLAMFKQILIGLVASDSDVVFLAEHDVVYHSSHFAFTPPKPDVYYYQTNVWKVDAQTGRAVTYSKLKQTSGLCADRQLLITHYRARVAKVETDGFSRRMGFEPGSHRRDQRIDDVPSDVWRAPIPNLDIRHGQNLTPSRWSPDEFRDHRNCRDWQEADAVPGWGVTKGRISALLADSFDLVGV